MLIFSLDVETIGVHGYAFSYGYVVRNKEHEIASGGAVMPMHLAVGSESDRAWVKANVSSEGLDKVDGIQALIDHFAVAWTKWSKSGALMMADCPVPCEAAFLFSARALSVFPWPYPLLDVESARASRGKVCESADRLPDELPAHHPIFDARQSVRLWFEASGEQ